MVISKSVINKCHNCNKYFIPSSKSNEKYCNNIYKTTNKTCKEYAAKAKYREEIKSEPIKKVHYTISQKYRMRISRSKVESIINKNKIEFQKYKDEYKKRKKDYKDGKLSEADFLKWLNEKKEVE